MKTVFLIALFLSRSAFADLPKVFVMTDVRGWNAMFLCDTDANTQKKYELSEVHALLQREALKRCTPLQGEIDETTIIVDGDCKQPGGTGVQPVFRIFASAGYRCR